jgi:hypothetical protein
MSRAREVSKIVATVDSVENSIDNIGNIDLSSTINTASAAAVAYLIDGAPEALNTLNELAAALNDNESFATTVTNELSSKLSISSASTIYLPQTTASATYLPLTGGSVSGNIRKPNNPSFLAYLSSRQSITAGTWNKVNLNTTRFNVGNHFNTSTSKFIVPITGLYMSSYNVNYDTATTGYIYSSIKINGAFYHYGSGLNIAQWNNDLTLGAGQIVSLNQNDEVEFWAYSGQANGLTSGLERTNLAMYFLG